MDILKISKVQLVDATQDLASFVAIPSISNRENSDYNPKKLEEAAYFAGKKLEELGFQVQYPIVMDSPPYVIAQRIVDSTLPTLLLYAHYDVQPVDRAEWKSDPFVLTERDERLYGRGASDDKGGIIAILAAVNTCIAAGVKLPNIKILFEGEEEFGSPNMEGFLNIHADYIKSNAMIVMDGLNQDSETGTITSSTRGILNIDVEVQVLEQPVHSGIGLDLPDPMQDLALIISSLKPNLIPGFLDGMSPIEENERKILRERSISAETYLKDNRALSGIKLRGDPNASVYEHILNEPNITIINSVCGKRHGGNSIQDKATCTVSMRLAPGQDPEHTEKVVIAYIYSLAKRLESGAKVTAKAVEKGSPAWKANLAHEFTSMYFKSLKENFSKVCAMPCGGAIPLLTQIQRVLPQMEEIVPAVEDHKTNAHSHNESQSKLVFENAINSLISMLIKTGNMSKNENN